MEKSLTETQEKKILESTPKEFVRFRPGPGGTQLAYVEMGYMISKLNETFNYLWDFKVTGEQVGKKQIWVKGELTAHLSPELIITKSNYGGAPIKFFQGTEDPVDIGNDLKAAVADCLKKCASMFGIAQDIYWKDAGVSVGETKGTNPAEPF